jgi:hypothetical protein
LDNAFEKCSNLTYVSFGKELVRIQSNAFKSCSSLEEIIIPQNVVRIKQEAFSGCSFLKDATLPNSIISIEKAAFAECNKLSSFTYPENLISLDNLFYIIQQGSVKIPNNITTIYWNAIDFIQPLIFSNGNSGSVYGIGFEGGFYNSYITNVVLGEKVKTIPAYFCYKLKRLKEITIPNSVTKIEESAFQYCDSLVSITLGNGITSIGNSAFYNCTSLINITIPEKVNKIGASVFSQCKNLKTIYCKATTPPTLEKYSIPETIEIIYVPNASLEKYRIKWSDYAAKIVGYDF